MNWRLLAVLLIALTVVSSLAWAYRSRTSPKTDRQTESLAVGPAETWEAPI